MATIDETKIKENAEGPKKAEIDGMVVEQHSIRDQIFADQYLAGKSAMDGTGLGIKFNKFKPPGAI